MLVKVCYHKKKFKFQKRVHGEAFTYYTCTCTYIYIYRLKKMDWKEKGGLEF